MDNFLLQKQAIAKACDVLFLDLLNIVYQYDGLDPTVPGTRLDCLDTFGMWFESEVLHLYNREIYVSYIGWSSKWNEWIHTVTQSARLAPLYSQSPSDEAGVFSTDGDLDTIGKQPSEENKRRRIMRFVKNPYNKNDCSEAVVLEAYNALGWYIKPTRIAEFIEDTTRLNLLLKPNVLLAPSVNSIDSDANKKTENVDR